jgi:F-type H+-transporting ATPase subunit epsilon
MNLSIIAPNRRIFSGNVSNVLLPGELGPFQVLPNHAPTLSSLTAGNVTYAIGAKVSSIAIKNGFVSIEDDEIKVVCEPMES